MNNPLRLKPLYRSFAVDRGAIDEEKRTVALAFSSESPVDRFFGTEILDHTPRSVRMGRIADSGPVLVDHEPSDVVGTVEQASIDKDRHGRALARFGRSARAEEIWQDVKDGIRKHISVGYRVHAMQLESADAKAGETYRVTDWEPLELSIVSIPADTTVGIGRSDNEDNLVTITRSSNMSEETKPAPAVAAVAAASAQVTASSDQFKNMENEIRAKELDRVKTLDKVGREYAQFGGDELARQCIAEGKGLGDLQQMLLEKVGKRQVPNHGEIGLTQAEKKDFRIARLIHAIVNPTDKRAQAAAAFEFECSTAALQVESRQLRNGAQAVIPYDVLAYSKRDLLSGTTTLGGYTVGTDMLGASFVDLLKNKTHVIAAGATMLSGLQGHVAIPTLSTSATAYWVAENTAPTEGAMNFGQITLSPKMLGAYVDVSRRLILQSSIDVENFIRGELASQIAVEIDRVVLNGAGTGSEPSGILTSTSVGTSTAGTNGLAPVWQNIVDLETLVANANGDAGALAYFTNPKVRGKCKTIVKSTSAVAGFLWDAGSNPLNGYPAYVSNNIPSTFTKGTSTAICSALLFGNFNDVILGQWGGGVDLMVDPYTGGNAGTVRVIALTDVDVAIRRAGSFAYIKDLLAG